MIFQKVKSNINPIFEILRWNKPTGRLILLIPAGWSLWLSAVNHPSISIIFKILIGGILVSGFGCVANDIWDIEIDKKVIRTKGRPLASNKINLKSAYLILFILIIGSFFLTLSLPEEGRLLSLLLAILVLPLILIYPSAKRWFKFPQLILSLCWGFSVLIPWAAQQGNLRSPVLLFCWLATLFWTFGFDTIYALADKKYDLKIGINSSAINLKSNTKIIVQICYGLTSLFIATCAIIKELNYIFWPLWLFTSFMMQKDTLRIFKKKEHSIEEVSLHFKNQVIYGSLYLISIILF